MSNFAASNTAQRTIDHQAATCHLKLFEMIDKFWIKYKDHFSARIDLCQVALSFACAIARLRVISSDFMNTATHKLRSLCDKSAAMFATLFGLLTILFRCVVWMTIAVASRRIIRYRSDRKLQPLNQVY